jgi:FlaG/FlaF family flagellin (archaellin)
MKGVSAVIAIILILMIVVALAALAYTWFTGIFTSLTESTGTAVTSTTGAMATQFVIENAACDDTGAYDLVDVVVRNTGTADINTTAFSTYINDVYVTHAQTDGVIGAQGVSVFEVGTATDPADCSLVDPVLKVVSGTGLSKTITIS